MVKKILVVLTVGFVGYYLFTAPETSADFVKATGSILFQGFESLGRFASRLAA